MPVRLNSSGGGSVTLDVPSTAGTFTATVPANTGTLVTTGSTAVVSQGMLASGVAGNGPAFSAYAGSPQSVSANTFTKVAINTERFDTNSTFDTSLFRFTPNVAGYYQINGIVRFTTTASNANLIASIFRNGFDFVRGGEIASTAINGGGQWTVSSLIYFNGSTDYVELFGYCSAGTVTFGASDASVTSSFSGFLARAA